MVLVVVVTMVVVMAVVCVSDTESQWSQVEYKGENKSFHLEKVSSMFIEKRKDMVGATFGRIVTLLSSQF